MPERALLAWTNSTAPSLRALQDNGRATCEALGAPHWPVAQRRAAPHSEAGRQRHHCPLRRAGAPEAVGLGLTAYLNVRLAKHIDHQQRSPMELFRAAVHTWPEVVECAALTGDMDYLLRVLVADMAHYSRFIRDTFAAAPQRADCKTSFMLERFKPPPPCPCSRKATNSPME